MKPILSGILYCLLFLCVISHVHAQWIRQYPMPKLEDVLDLDVGDDGYGFAVGSNDLILRSLAGNNQWELLPGFGEGWRFNAVDYLQGSGGSVAAAGGDGLILTIDKGEHWNEVAGAPAGIHTIKIFSPTHLIVATANGVFSWNNDIWNDLNAPAGIALKGAFILNDQYIWTNTTAANHLIYYTVNGGMNWTINLDLPRVDIVRFFDTETGIALDGRDVYKSTDGGQSYTLIADNGLKNSANDLTFGSTPDVLIAATLNALPNISTDGGLTWEDITTDLINQRSYSVSALSNTEFWIGNDVSSIMHSSDGGMTWQETSGPTRNLIQDVYFLNRMEGYASGQKGMILRTHDGGVHWDDISFGTRSHLCIHGLHANDLWIGTNQRILHSTDAGDTWVESVVFPGGNINDVLAISHDRILAASTTGYIYLSKNGGTTWDSVYNSGTQMRSIARIDDLKYMATGFNGVIVRSDDQGESWDAVTIPEAGLQYEQSYFHNGEGWLVTSSFKRSMWHTTDAGNTWDTLTLPIDRFWDGVYFISRDTGIVVARSAAEGRAYITFDGGHHWQSGYITSFPLYGVTGVPNPNGTAWIFGFGSDIEILPYCNSFPAISNFMGELFPCERDTVMYSVSSQHIDQFNWLFPPGWQILGNPNNDTLQVIAGTNSGFIRVRGSNLCGETGQLNFSTSPHLLPAIFGITGDNEPCLGQVISYSVDATNVEDFSWSLPADWSFIGNPNQSTIMVQVGSTEGLISVNGSNTCGITGSTFLFVSPGQLPSLSFVSGDLNPCKGDTVIYIISSEPENSIALNAQGLEDWSILSSAIPNTIIVIAGNSPGILQIIAANECGFSSPLDLELNPIFVPEVGILADGNKLYPTSQGVSYQWFLDGIPIAGATSDTLTPVVGGSYSVAVTFANGCSALSLNVNVVISAVHSPLSFLPLELYPIPASEELFIKGINGKFKFTIIDLLGKKILEGQATTDRIQLESLSEGLYILKVESGKYMYSARFIVVKE